MDKESIEEGQIYTSRQIKKLGLVNTGQHFADLLLYRRDRERYLLQRAGRGRFRVYCKYSVKGKVSE